MRCDEVLHTDDVLARLWPLVDAERQAVRRVVAGARLLDLWEEVLRLAVLTGTDLSALSVAGLREPPVGGGDETSDAGPGLDVDGSAAGASK